MAIPNSTIVGALNPNARNNNNIRPQAAKFRRARCMSIENSNLTEVLTIYEKLKKGHGTNVFRQSEYDTTGGNTYIDIDLSEVEEAVSYVPRFNKDLTLPAKALLDFNKYKNVEPTKYLYFSQHTNLLQGNVIEDLGGAGKFDDLLSKKNYWLNIIDPNEQDFAILFHSYGVHDLTINDIREGYTEEKMEVFKHYTFFSLRLLYENMKQDDNEDVDFNILLFKDFVITMHDKQWPSITDMLGFLNLLLTHGGEPSLNPDWVLFSCFVEMSQDAKYIMDLIEPEINKIRISSKSAETMSDLMRRNFNMELQVYSIARFIKPKNRILRHLKQKCGKRINKIILNLLSDMLKDFKEMEQDLNNFNHILERSQDTFLTVVTSEQTKEANDTNKVMKRISEIALIFVPIQAISSFMGMNCTVPFQSGDDYPNTIWFWTVVGFSFIVGISLYFLRTRILARY